jgi:hypothetical protein
MSDNRERPCCLEFSSPEIELTVNPGEIIEDIFTIHAADMYAQGNIYSSDTRMRLYETQFGGTQSQIGYCFDGTNSVEDSEIKGEFVIISNYGEYTIPYHVYVQKPQLECSIGVVKNLFHFTNLAQTDWNEAVELFYSPEFTSILHKNDRNAYLSYIGLSKNIGNEQNMEEFLIEVNKKAPVIYNFSVEGFVLEDVQDSITKSIVINKSGWGYSYITLTVNGDFISVDKPVLTNEDFSYNACDFNIYIDATKLHNGINSGSIVFSDACNDYTIPVDILMDDEPQRRNDSRKQKQSLCNMAKGYVDMKYKKITQKQWADIFEKETAVFWELDEDSILHNLYKAQSLILKERFNEAKWYLDLIEQRLEKDDNDLFLKCYYFYLTTLLNKDEIYIDNIGSDIESVYANGQTDWRLGWFILQINREMKTNSELRWQFMENMFLGGCSSPLLLCEAVLLLCDNPTLLIKIDKFEENVLWHGAKHQVLKPELIEQLQYLSARKKTYSPLLFRTLCEVYNTYKSPQTVASICHMLILGEKKGTDYYEWYSLGVEHSVRVTGLYEYYMMSLALDKYGDIMEDIEIPKMVLMYFAYQSNLDYELNAFLYAYIIKNKDIYPDLEQSYRIAIERFVVDQIKAGHINENLAYLYKNVLVSQMITDETVYAYTPLLFMHRIYVDNPKVKNIVVIHEKVNGESSYPVVNSVCMIPIYGSEYKLFLQDEYGNRFTKSVFYENKQLMEPKRQLQYVSGYIQGRLSFDIYLCEVDKNFVTITHDNVKRFKNLVESPQVVDSFKKEIRTKLLKFYYDNDMIGELDTFLEDIEADEMEAPERAVFIRYLVSRGMFDKAYCWVKAYGVAGVEHKTVARLISKKIVSKNFEYEEFLVNVSFYIYKNMKYDENILRYLMINYNGKSSELRKILKSAMDLELDAVQIMERILRQMKYTGIIIPDRDSILVDYANCEGHDDSLVKELLIDASYEYFVYEAIIYPEIFDMIYQKYADGELDEKVVKLALLRFWADNRCNDIEFPEEAAIKFIQEFIKKDIYFPFFVKFADIVPELHYVNNYVFVEYRTNPHSQVYIHYAFDDSELTRENTDKEDLSKNYECYEINEMRDMYEGIYVSMFQLFHGERLQYYITESYSDSDKIPQEHVTQSDTIYGKSDQSDNRQGEGRFEILNDILLSISLKDEVTAQQLTEEYLYKDFIARELFRVL